MSLLCSPGYFYLLPTAKLSPAYVNPLLIFQMDEDFMLMLLMGSSDNAPSRSVWVRDSLRLRDQLGEQATLMKEDRMNPEDFHSNYRMSPERFDELLTRVGPKIEKEATRFREPVSAEARLAMTIK